MTYEEAFDARSIVSRSEARREIEAHGQTWAAWLLEYDDMPTYRAATVLAWLGY